MWGEIAGAIVGGVAKTLTSKDTYGGESSGKSSVPKPNYQGFMMAPDQPKVATGAKSTPAPVAGSSDAIQAWMDLLTSYKAK